MEGGRSEVVKTQIASRNAQEAICNRTAQCEAPESRIGEFAKLSLRMKSDRLTLAAGLSLLVPLLFWLFSGEGPTVLYPFPALVFVPALLFLRWAAVAVPMMLFFLWNPGLFNGDVKVPKRSYVLMMVATLVTIPWFVLGWKDGLAVQGAGYNYSVLIINIGWLAILWVMFARSRNAKPSFKANLLLHWVLFAWLAWYAFPFFGELT